MGFSGVRSEHFALPRSVPDARSQAIVESAHLASEPDVAPEGTPGLAGPVPPAHPQHDQDATFDSVRANLTQLAGPPRLGAVSQRWTAYGILTCLGLVYHLKPSASLNIVLALAATLFFFSDQEVPV